MYKKLCVNILIIIAIIFCNILPAYGVDVGPIINSDKNTAINDQLVEIRSNALGVAQVIGMVVAMGMLIFVAIKYLTSSPNDRADVKQYAIPFVIGAVCIFAAIGIVQLISIIANEMANSINL